MRTSVTILKSMLLLESRDKVLLVLVVVCPALLVVLCVPFLGALRYGHRDGSGISGEIWQPRDLYRCDLSTRPFHRKSDGVPNSCGLDGQIDLA